MNRVNTKSLKSKLKPSDYEKIFKALNIPIYSKGNRYWSLWTGCHNKDALKGSPKLLYYPDTGMLQCLTQCACNHDIIALVQKRLALLGKPSSFQDSVNFIIETTGLEFDTVKRINVPNICNWQDSLERFSRFKTSGQKLPIYDKAILSQLDRIYPQSWIDEGISIETMDKYQIGFYRRTQATTIPCFNKEGDLIGIRVRNWNTDEIDAGKKYIPLQLLDGSMYNFPTKDVFYGINRNWGEIERTGTVILFESEKSVLKLDTIYDENNTALAMFGKILGKVRKNQLIEMGVNKVIYCPDNDWINRDQTFYDKWEKEVIQFGEQFKGYASVEVVWDNMDLLQPKDNASDQGKETWTKLYENREVLI